MAPEQWLRRAGYAYIRDRRSGQDSFSRRLGGGFYPRFHIYFSQDSDKIIFNLHLDQKQASYAGAHKHNAEYGGELVGAEITRLKDLSGNGQDVLVNAPVNSDPLDRMSPGEYDKKAGLEPKKSWWRRVLGW